MRCIWAPDWAVAAGVALLSALVGALGFHGVRSALSALGPTVGFLAALVLADGCLRAGLFDALGAATAFGAGSRPRQIRRAGRRDGLRRGLAAAPDPTRCRRGSTRGDAR